MKNGDRLGPYTLLRPLGAGGMGVVYLARDERLDREVAIKALPQDSLRSDSARRRFRQEALALAKLNHPNIASLYDIVEQDGSEYLVLEHVAGSTLAERLKSGPLSAREALALGGEIAAALDEAHRLGIVHRDLKPGNVIVTPRGSAKVLDFGLAKLLSPEADTPHTSLVDTATRGIVGTAPYMSPEQAEGQPVDSRADLWSLGVVLYEALAGETPFRGTSLLSILRAVTAAAPRPLRAVRADAPEDAARIVERALEKDVAKRYQSAADMARDLSTALARLSSPVAPPRRHRPGRRVGTAIVVSGIALAALLAWPYRRFERRRWAREEAIPRIAQLQAQDLPLAAFLLAKQAQPYLAADFERTQEEKIRLVEITSSPPGATVEIQDYLTPEGAWYRLGATPMEKVVVPEGYFRWRVSKAGVGQYVAAPETSERLSFPLQPAQPVPQGMTSVPGGRFFGMIDFIGWLGPYDLPAFSIDRLEVTNREYQAFVDAGGYQKREYWREPVLRDGRTLGWDEAAALFRDRAGRPGPSTWEGGHYPEGQGEMPVSGVSWYEATAYAAYSARSLPALAQWFQAAPPELAPYAVRLSNFSGSAPARVGSFAGVGPYGTYDMAGNVREWTRNACAGGQRFILGGAWSSQTYLSADPETLPALDRSPQNGIRCVRNAADLPAAATGPIRTQERDLRHAKPVGDAVFRAYAPLYAYDRTPLEARVEGEPRDTPDWQELTISIAAAYGRERLPIHLFLPKRVHPPFQAVVFFPSARVLLVPDSQKLGDLPFVDYVIQSGRALLYPIYQGTYERRVRFELPGASQTTELVTERFKDLGRSLDYLATRSDIDHDRLAYLGVSMGAAEGVIYATLIQNRLKAVVLLDGGFFLDRPPAGIDQLDFAPRLKTPVLMVNGRYDFTFSLEHAQRPLVDWIGAPAGDKRHVVLESPHDVSMRRTELVPEVLGWLDKYLGRVE